MSQRRKRRIGAFGVGAVVLVAGGTVVGAECRQVYQRDFVGKKCTNTNSISHQGTFSDISGGTLTGSSNISYKSDDTYSHSRGGTLRSQAFEGKMYREERKSRNPAGTLVTNVLEDRSGKHRLDDGGTLEGSSRLDDFGDGTYRLQKSGKIDSPGFTGKLYTEDRKSRSVSGTLLEHRIATLSGQWRVGEGNILTGVLEMRCENGQCQTSDTRQVMP